MTIFLMPMEPLEQRYSSQWLQYFQNVFTSSNIPYEIILGKTSNYNLQSKFFLDPIGTNIWKLTQLVNLLENFDKVKSGDTIFFTDLWNPGLEVLPYIKALINKDIKISGYLHAGTYDPWDLTTQTGMASWAKGLEESWFQVCDKIFVATQFHKDLLMSTRTIPNDNVKVVGFPMDIQHLTSEYGNNTKEPYLVFTGRKSIEKGYQKVLKLQANNNIIVSLDKYRTKDEYYNLLSKASGVIAPSEQETFGIGVVEGMCCGCIPIVPDRLSFKETVPYLYRYINENKIQDYINTAINATENDRRYIQNFVKKYQYQTVINNIIQELL
jgi:glycosyltransferase involved in cell wall biosynthesis